MATFSDVSGRINFHLPIPVEEALVFNPAYIIYCVYSFKVSGAADQPRVELAKTIKTYKPDFMDIDDFVRQVVANQITAPEISNPPQYGGPEPISPYDIGIDDQCFIVIEMDRTTNWSFSRLKPALTQSGAYPGENGNMFHVRPSNGNYNMDPIADEDCRIMYFSVRARSDQKRRKFDCNIRVLQGQPSEASIDPDIRNTGANPTIP